MLFGNGRAGLGIRDDGIAAITATIIVRRAQHHHCQKSTSSRYYRLTRFHVRSINSISRSSAYVTHVRPLLEYNCLVRSPHNVFSISHEHKSGSTSHTQSSDIVFSTETTHPSLRSQGLNVARLDEATRAYFFHISTVNMHFSEYGARTRVYSHRIGPMVQNHRVQTEQLYVSIFVRRIARSLTRATALRIETSGQNTMRKGRIAVPIMKTFTSTVELTD